MSDEHKAPLAIENTAANPDKDAQVMEVGGEAIKLDALGPLIVNADGVCVSLLEENGRQRLARRDL